MQCPRANYALSIASSLRNLPYKTRAKRTGIFVSFFGVRNKKKKKYKERKFHRAVALAGCDHLSVPEKTKPGSGLQR